jgi:hypothetical protein
MSKISESAKIASEIVYNLSSACILMPKVDLTPTECSTCGYSDFSAEAKT